MSYPDTRADRPLTRRRYPPNNNNNNSSSDPNSTGALVPIPQPYPLVSSTVNNNATVEMDRYMAYMDLGQLLEHNMDTLFPAVERDAVHAESNAAYRNYLMEIEDSGAGGLNNGSQIFAQIPSVDTRSHHQRSTRGNSRILRNFVLMDGRAVNETTGHSTRRPPTYQNNFPDFSNTAHAEDAFLFHFETKSSTDPFTPTGNQPSIEDPVHLHSTKWLDTVSRKYKLDEVFEEYKLQEAEKHLDEDQRTFARELFFAAMFYEDDEGGSDRLKQVEEKKEVIEKKMLLKPFKKYW